MPIAAEPFSFAKARGDGIYLLRSADSLTIIGRIGCLVFIPFWLWFVSRPLLLIDLGLVRWEWPVVLSIPVVAIHFAMIGLFPVVISLFFVVYVSRLLIDTYNRCFTVTEGPWPFWSSQSGNLEDIRFVRMSSTDRRETRRGRGYSSKHRYIGFKACLVFESSEFLIIEFSQSVNYDGTFASDFPWEVYSKSLNEIRTFFEPLGVEVRDEIGGRKEDS